MVAHAPRARRCGHRPAFTLVELLVVVGVIAVLIGVLMPALSKARQAAVRTQCLSNVRQLLVAQAGYAAEQDNLLVVAGDGTEQGSWIGLLQRYARAPLVRRCPGDQSVFFDQPIGSSNPPRFRTTSYGINNYVSPTHAPFGVKRVAKISQVRRASAVIQFAELAEAGSYGAADHLHVQDFYNVFSPQATPSLVGRQMPLGRHGGRAATWEAVLNYGFLDGHAESLPLRAVYLSPSENRFNPVVAK